MIEISVRSLTIWLGGAVVFLLGVHTALQAGRFMLERDYAPALIRLFDVDREGNVPTWFSALALLLCAGLLVLIASSSREQGHPYARHWAALAVIFVGLSLDEAASIHEMSIVLVREILGGRGALDQVGGALLRRFLGVSGAQYFAWVIPAVVAVGVAGLSYLPFLRHLPAPTRTGIIMAGLIYFGGALGVELAGAWVADRLGQVAYVVAAGIEEALEMTGTVFFARVLASYLVRLHGSVTLSFRP
jgi:hypothetical protein